MENIEQDGPSPGELQQEAEDLFCPACGRLEPAPARFCGRCGKPLVADTAPRAPSSAAPGYRPRRHRNWHLKRWAVRSLLLAALGGLIYVLASGRLEELTHTAMVDRDAGTSHTGPRVDEAVWKVMTGQDGILISATGRDIPLAGDRTLINEAVQAEASRDRASLKQLVAAGRVVMATPRTRVTVLDTAFLNTVAISKVRALEGPAQGKQGWVLASQVDR